MKIETRILWELMTEFIMHRPCGCAWILRTGEQVAFCPTCGIPPVQLTLELES